MGKPVFPDQHPVVRLRSARSLSLRALARQAGIDFRRLSVVERGFTQTELRRLARALSCSPGDLQTTTGVDHAAA